MRDPIETIQRSTFDGLLEYSCSLPTGVTPGKVWKCNVNAYRPPVGTHPPEWVIREYVSNGDGTCRVEQRVPKIIDKDPTP